MIGARGTERLDDARLSQPASSRREHFKATTLASTDRASSFRSPFDDGIPLGDRSLPRPAQHQEPDSVRTSSMLIRTTIIRSRSCWRILR